MHCNVAGDLSDSAALHHKNLTTIENMASAATVDH